MLVKVLLLRTSFASSEIPILFKFHNNRGRGELARCGRKILLLLSLFFQGTKLSRVANLLLTKNLNPAGVEIIVEPISMAKGGVTRGQ